MAFPSVVLPGQRFTANRANAGFAIGRKVFFASRDAAQAITTGGTSGSASNALSWDNLITDDLGGWDAGSPTRYTPTEAGWYRLVGAVGYAGSTSGTLRGVTWLVNGAVAVASSSKTVASSSIANTTLTVPAQSIPVELNGTTDYVQLCPFHDVGSNLSTATGSFRSFASVYFVRPST